MVSPRGWPNQLEGAAVFAHAASLDPQTSLAHQIVPSRYSHDGVAVLGEEGRPVEIDDIAMLADDECRGHREAGADHVADHHAEAEPPRLFGDQQAPR